MEIRSVQEYISLVEKLKTNYTYSEAIGDDPALGTQLSVPHFIFRGHGWHEGQSMLPGIFRWKDSSQGYSVAEFSQMEHNILNDFISEACRFIRDVPEGDIATWLELAQHYGAPTRLLDFTENPLVALYFACSSFMDRDASVWIVNEPAYNRKFFSESAVVQTSKSQSIVNRIITCEIIRQDRFQNGGEPLSIDRPWIYKPHYHAERMNLQASVFMIWGADRRPLTSFVDVDDYIEADQPAGPKNGVLGYVLIRAGDKKRLIEQLDFLGINEKFVYPGIDGVGRYIRNKYSSKYV